jgi:predicted phosphodiesterase
VSELSERLRELRAEITGPEWPVIQPAEPISVTLNVPGKFPDSLGPEWKTAVVFPDPQIGFRKYDDGTLDPFHDEKAINVALQVAASLPHVDQIINLGDFLDLPSQGKFDQEASFSNTTQAAIDAGFKFLAVQRAIAPDAKIIVLEGNHDKRMQRFITNNAMAAFGLRKAEMPESWPVMSLPYLLRMDELDITYIDAYPTGTWWVNDKLRAIHGDKVRSNGSTAAAYTNDMSHISTIFGHIHRQEIQSKTTYDRTGKLKTMAISPGCLCRVDGAVPSVKGSIGIDGKPAVYWENWQQGILVINYKDTGAFHVEMVHIDDGKTIFRDQEFTTY